MLIKLLVVTSTKCFGRSIPRITLAGLWLNEFAFNVGNLVCVDYSKGNIILKTQGDGTCENYKTVSKKLIRNTSKGLVYVYTGSNIKKKFPHIDIVGLRLSDSGFTVGSIVAVKCEHELIHLKALDFDKIQKEFS